MNYSNLRSQILAAIKYPPKIGAASLQEQLINIVNGLDLGALFLGVATPSLTPNTEANGFYFALQSGTYTNFPTINGQTITVDSSEVAIIVRSGNYWSKIHITTYPTIDPTTKHWMIGKEDTGVLAEGTTPHIDQESGNWMIGTYDTGIHAQGAPGKNGQDAYQPFKGTFSSVSDLNAAYPKPNEGDTAHVEDTVDNATVLKVYDVVNGEWHDTGTTADSPVFGSGQLLSSVKIDDTHLANPKDGSLPKAEDVKAVVADDDDADLDIADNNGKVIMRLANGEIATKNFNSAATPSIGDTFSVLDIADSQGNVVMRIDSLGNIFTFGFDSTTVVLKDAVNSVSDSINAFVDKMNEYAANFGMTNTHFLNASGQDQTGHYSTSKDIMRMCACCTAYEKLMRYWGLLTFTFHVAGANARDIIVESSYKGSAMESVGDYYHIYGGKSGTWNVGGSVGTVRNLTLVVKSKVDDMWLVGCVIKTSDTDRGIAFKQLMDWLEAYRQDSTTQPPTINADYAAAGIIQPHNPMAYADVDYCLVSKNGDTQYLPASMTKLMTAMVALDYCSLDETLTIIASDIQSGSGSTFYAGDQIRIADAIPAMLLPSSNTLAVAISRYVGNKIINIKNR